LQQPDQRPTVLRTDLLLGPERIALPSRHRQDPVREIQWRVRSIRAHGHAC
jgi:hypothetical protein